MAAIGVISAAAMNIKAVREPVLNFVFHKSINGNKTNINSKTKANYNISFDYIPNGYTEEKVTYSMNKNQATYKFYNKNNNNKMYIDVQMDQQYDAYINQSSLSKYDKITYKNRTYYFLSGDDNTLITYKNHCIISIISPENQKQLLKIATYSKVKHK